MYWRILLILTIKVLSTEVMQKLIKVKSRKALFSSLSKPVLFFGGLFLGVAIGYLCASRSYTLNHNELAEELSKENVSRLQQHGSQQTGSSPVETSRQMRTSSFEAERISAGTTSVENTVGNSVEQSGNSTVLSLVPDAANLNTDAIVSNAWHDLNDTELFRTVGGQNGSQKKMCARHKIAFLFLTKGPLPMAPLWKRFFEGHRPKFSIYIHATPGYEFSEMLLPQPFRKRQIPSQKVEWGTVSMVDAERRLLANALLDPCNARFVLVSESCIPLYNFTYIYNFLMDTETSLVSAYDLPGKFGRGRYNKRFLPDVTQKQWRKGTQWFEMTLDAALMVVNDITYYEKFKKFCYHWCFSDEHYIPTLMYILIPSKITHVGPTYVDWTEGGDHPKEFAPRDLTTRRLDDMRRGGKCTLDMKDTHCTLFARKMKPSALGWLLRARDTLGY